MSFNLQKGLFKGRPTALLVSLAVHAGLIFLAGIFVVVNIAKKPPVKFEPVEKIERPRLKLKKIQVKVKENKRPRDTTEQITTKTTLPSLSVSLPPMRNAEVNIDTSFGGFDVMEDMDQMTLLGAEASVGNDLIGTYYYLQQNRDGDVSGIRGLDDSAFANVLRNFFRYDWDESVFDPYWRASKKLFATQFFIPKTISSVAPDYFGDTRQVEAAHWLVHYKGKISNKEGGRFRFWGTSDDFLYVRINGRTVLDASYPRWRDLNYAGWLRYAPSDDRRYQVTGDNRFRWHVGNWFEISPGEPVEMEVLLGEEPGGEFWAMLAVQEEGVEYAERPYLPGPLLPIFKTAPTPQNLVDQILYLLPPGVVDITNGPIFNLY